MEMEPQWIIDIKKEIEKDRESSNSLTSLERERKKKERRCIYKVPNIIKRNREQLYTPHFVSIGPFHHGSKHLEGMEKFKRKWLCCFLAAIGQTLEEALQEMSKKAEELMDAYGDDLEERWMNKDYFVLLMVIDACFLLMYILTDSDIEKMGLEKDERFAGVRLEAKGLEPSVCRDIGLLENQLPTGAVHVLVELVDKDLTRYLDYYCDDDNYKSYHVLDVARKPFINKWNNFVFIGRMDREVNPPTITELVNAGVQVKLAKFDIIKFDKENGVLELPSITFDDWVETRLLNMMAYEAMHNLDPEVYSYMEFLDSLINTSKHVEILRKKKIICGGLGSDEEIASFFNRIRKEVYPPQRKIRNHGEDIAKLLLEDYSKLLDDYSRNWHHKSLIGSFQSSYLSNPWAFFGLLGAIFLLALTICQTVYTVLGYYPH